MTTHQGLPTSKQSAHAAINGFGALVDRFSNAGTAAEVAHAVLREAILSNVLSPGTRLRADELAKHLGVSKTPVREALRKLQAEDFIVVSRRQRADSSKSAVGKASAGDLFAEALEGMAARHSLRETWCLVARSRAVLEDRRVRAACDQPRNFRREIARLFGAHNDFLHDLLKVIQGDGCKYSTKLTGRQSLAKAGKT